MTDYEIRLALVEKELEESQARSDEHHVILGAMRSDVAVLTTIQKDLQEHIKDDHKQLALINENLSAIMNKLNNGMTSTLEAVAATQSTVTQDIVTMRAWWKLFAWGGGILFTTLIGVVVSMLIA